MASEMHVRGCDCDSCLPGFPAAPTPVRYVRQRAGELPRPMWLRRKHERIKRLLAKQQRERHLAAQRRWREAHQDEIRAYMRTWRERRKAAA